MTGLWPHTPVQAADSGLPSFEQKVWLTEIYPNDIARHETYTGLSGSTIDSMDYIEVYNGSDTELDFGADYDLVYNDTGELPLTFNEAEVKIPARSTAVFWVRRVDLEKSDVTMPSEADFRASLGVPDEVPVFSVNNQKALKNSTATVRIVSKSTSEIMSSYTYVTADAGAVEGTSVHFRAAANAIDAVPIAKQAPSSAGQVSEEQTSLSLKPQLAAGTVNRMSESSAMVTFTSNKAGAYFYAAVPHGETAPTIDTTGNGTPIDAGENNVPLTALSAGAQDLYVVLKDTSGETSQPLLMLIPAYATIATGGVYLTEIYPNDIPRNQSYTGLSGSTIDSMDYIEVYNTSDTELDFGNSFDLVYTDLDVAVVSDLRLTFNEAEVKIPAQSAAVFWVRRVDLEKSDVTMPSEADFRASLGVPDVVPVFSVNNQKALKNTTARISIIAKGSQEPVSSYTYISTDAGSEEGSSVQLQAAEGVATAVPIGKKASPTAGQVNEQQKTVIQDSGVVPVLKRLGNDEEFNTIQEGTDLSIPYAYTDSTGIRSFTVFYRTDSSDEWTAQPSNSFNTRTPGKFYVEIGADKFLNASYIEYYLEARNIFHPTESQVHRVHVAGSPPVTGLRPNLSEGQILSGKVDITGRSSDNAEVAIQIDGAAVDTSRTLEQGAYFTLDINGLDGRKNAVLVNGTLVQVFSRWYNVLPSRAIKIDPHLFQVNSDGNAEVTIQILAGTEIDALDISSGTQSDNFNVTGFQLVLQDGTKLQPDGAVHSSDLITLNSSKRSVELHFTIPAGSMNANRMTWDTTKTPDGNHTISMSTSTENLDLNVVVDNTAPVISADVPAHINSSFTFEPGYSDLSEVLEETLMLKLDGTLLEGTSFNGSSLAPGTHELTAAVQDVHGNTGTRTWTFTSSVNVPSFSSLSSSDVKTDSAKLTAVLGRGADSVVSFHEATALTVGNGIKVYQGSGDDTAAAEAGVIGTVSSTNGSLPYQLYEFDVNNGDTSLRFELEAGTDYGKDVRLYVRSNDASRWLPLLSTKEEGKVSTVFETKDYAADGKVYVLAQGRGAELPPVTAASRPSTVKNNYVWDGTREPEQYDFAIAWTTDEQYYSESYPWNFETRNRYIVNNKERMDLRYLVNTGDLVDDIDETYQWEHADQYMKILEEAGLPYGVLAGNHDIANHNARYENYQSYFGANRFSESSVYGQSYKNNLGHYDLVTAGGQDMIFVYMSYDYDRSAADWMNEVLAKYSDRMAVLAFHSYTNGSGEQDAHGLFFQNEVVAKNPNVVMVLNGHYHGAAINVAGFDDDGDGIKERNVYQILTDYQSGNEGGDAYYQTLYFDLANGKVYVISYSPKLDDFSYYNVSKLPSYDMGLKATDLDTFELRMDFDTAPKTLNVKAVDAVLYDNNALGTVEATDAKASLAAKNLSAEATFSWIAIAANAAGKAYSELSTLTGVNPPPVGNPGSSGETPAPGNPGMDISTQGGTTTISSTVSGISSSSGRMAASVETGVLSKLIDSAIQAESSGNKAVVKLTLATEASVQAVDLSIPKDAFSSLADGTAAKLMVNVERLGAVTFDAAAVDAIHAASLTGDIRISIDRKDTMELTDDAKAKIGNRPVYGFTVYSGNRNITELGDGSASIRLPYIPGASEDPNAIVVYSIQDNGILKPARGAYHATSGTIELKTMHVSTFAIGYHKVTFSDVTAAHWSHAAVTYLAAREITDGTGNGAYSPSAKLTRGQFIVMLMRTYGIDPDEDSVNNFSDAGDTYYSDYLAASKRLGLSSGVGDNKFAPEREITRQDMFMLLYRTLEMLNEVPGENGEKATLSTGDFSDADQISSYALEAMEHLAASGMITGNGGKLNPKSTTTRAEMAQVLYNLLSR
ncbi:S-layer homology domain-containing protein [Paenibacillus sp. JSM ZJ436]|uniref:S-layer homology domain-containing protein n=1 Tax=Paenibacillus sp. JSM ZJ436 TaxID=3376190 RepID=UPI0037C57580